MSTHERVIGPREKAILDSIWGDIDPIPLPADKKEQIFKQRAGIPRPSIPADIFERYVREKKK